MNLYRGCAHGCVYCDSRSTCYQFTHPFEDIEVKRNAPELLEAVLRSKRKRIMHVGAEHFALGGIAVHHVHKQISHKFPLTGSVGADHLFLFICNYFKN